MTTDTAGTAVTGEAAKDLVADSSSLVEQDTNIPLDNVDPSENMSDEDFTRFMDAQFAEAGYSEDFQETGEAGETPTVNEKPAETEPTEGAVTDETTETDTGASYTVEIDGEQITVSDPADINRLIKRGLSYAAEAKANLPAQKLAQMLSNNELTDTAKLSRIIDASKGDVGALRALLKEHNIDPYSLVGNDDTDEYVPSDYSVSDNQIELNKVLDTLQDSESFATTADVVMEQWDAASRQEFMDKPQNFTILNSQVADGTYDAISKEIKKLSMLDKLPAGKTQFDVYKAVGDQMYANSMLPGQQAPSAAKEVSTQPEENEGQPTAAQRLQQAADLQKRKRAVAPSRSVPPKQTNYQVASEQFANSSSDEDFIAQTKHLFQNM